MNRVLSGLSMTDDLTGLYNRLGYHKIACPLSKQGRTGILFIDMDRLKTINDTFGHEQGDRAIKAVANAVLHNIPSEAVPVRYGGDEFLVVIPSPAADRLEATVQAITAALSEEAYAMGLHIPLEISTGVVIAEPGRPLDEYVREADALMYREKKSKRASRE